MNSAGSVHSVTDMFRLVSVFSDLTLKVRSSLQELPAHLGGVVLGCDVVAALSILTQSHLRGTARTVGVDGHWTFLVALPRLAGEPLGPGDAPAGAPGGGAPL